MNDTTTTSAEQAIKDELRRLGWMIPDAQRRLNEHAQTMLRRAEERSRTCEAMMAKPALQYELGGFRRKRSAERARGEGPTRVPLPTTNHARILFEEGLANDANSPAATSCRRSSRESLGPRSTSFA